MSILRNCKHCGKKISIRKMPTGHWVSFEYGTDNPHECHTQQKTSMKTKIDNDNYTDIASILSKSILNGYDVHIHYYTSYRAAWTDRVVTPKNLYKRGTNYYLEAYCHFRKEDRTFKVKNINSAYIVKSNIEVVAKKDSPSYKETSPTPKPTTDNNTPYWFWILVIVIIIYLLLK